MVVASSRAGVLGSLGVGLSSAAETRKAIADIREGLDTLPFNVNLFLLEVSVRAMVFSHWRPDVPESRVHA
jgi:hypothetical protein